MNIFLKKETGIISSIEFKSAKIRIVYWCMFLIVLFVALLCLLPILWVVLSAFKDEKEFFSIPPTIIPKSFHPEKIGMIWNKVNFGRSYIATIFMILGDLVFSLTVNGLAGYVLSRLRPRGTKLVHKLMLWSMMLPATMSMVPLFMSFIDFPIFHWNLTNSFLPLWMMAGANPFNVLLFKGFFDSISISYIEAARIDGCTDFGIFTKIIMPLSKPIVMTVSIFCINGAWGSFFWPFLLIKNDMLAPVGLKIFQLKTVLSADEYMMSLIFVIVPAIIVFLCMQKYIMEGFTLGGLKG